MGSNYLALISNNWQAGLPSSSGDLELDGSGYQPQRRGAPVPEGGAAGRGREPRDTQMISETWLLVMGQEPLAEFTRTSSRRWETVAIMKGQIWLHHSLLFFFFFFAFGFNYQNVYAYACIPKWLLSLLCIYLHLE